MVVGRSSQTLLEGRRGVGVRRGDLHGVPLGVVRQDKIDADVIVVDLAVRKLGGASAHLLRLPIVGQWWHGGCLAHAIGAGRAEGCAFGSRTIAAGDAAAGAGMVARGVAAVLS